MTDPVSPKRSAKRAKLCSIENANRVATGRAGQQRAAGAHGLAGGHLQ